MKIRRIAFVSALTAVAAAVPAAPAMAGGGDIKVMTRNLYLGADIITLADLTGKQTVDEFKVNASAIWKTVETTNFPKRAPALAKEIKAAKPDLIGLQEASLWRTGPSDPNAEATKVKYDFTAELIKALKKKGMVYKVVVSQPEFDFEAPIVGADVRLTQRDVILKRKGSKIKTGKTSKGHYTDNLVVPTAVGPADSIRGWVAVDAKVGGKSFKFVNTHFEAYDLPPGLRASQATQLVGSGGPLADASKPAILLGDFNSDPAQTGTSGDAYRNVIGAGFTNIWGTRTDVRTIGRDELLAKQDGSEFIDQITYRPAANFTVRSKKVIGNNPFSKSVPKWSSDHNGVTATLRLK